MREPTTRRTADPGPFIGGAGAGRARPTDYGLGPTDLGGAPLGLRHPRARAVIAGHPIHAALVPFPIATLTLALVTDIMFWRTGNLMWQNFSAWLLFAGAVTGGLAALFGAIDLLSRREVRAQRPAWPHAIGNVVILVIVILNNFVHSGDGWTAVVPWGLALSAITVVLMLVTVWLGRSLVYRHAVEVRAHD